MCNFSIQQTDINTIFLVQFVQPVSLDQNLGDKKVVTVNSAQKLGGMYFLYNYCQCCSKAKWYVFLIYLLSKLLKS
jgi:hypothetical protein